MAAEPYITRLSIEFSLCNYAQIVTQPFGSDADNLVYALPDDQSKRTWNYACGEVSIGIDSVGGWRGKYGEGQGAGIGIYPVGIFDQEWQVNASVQTMEDNRQTGVEVHLPLRESRYTGPANEWSQATHTATIIWDGSGYAIYLDDDEYHRRSVLKPDTQYGRVQWAVSGAAQMYALEYETNQGGYCRWNWDDPTELKDLSRNWELKYPPPYKYFNPIYYDARWIVGQSTTDVAVQNVWWDYLQSPFDVALIKDGHLTTNKWLMNAWGLRALSGWTGDTAATTDKTYRTKLARAAFWGERLLYRRVEQPSVMKTWSDEIQIAYGTRISCPALAAYEDGVVTCWWMDNDTQHASLSTDDGRTWTELTNMMGSSLRNVAVTQHHGITLGVGISGGSLYFVRSNDQGRTQDAQPGGAGAQQLIGTCAADCRPCITWYPDGEVAVWAEDDAGNQITYTNPSSGFGAWSRVS